MESSEAQQGAGYWYPPVSAPGTSGSTDGAAPDSRHHSTPATGVDVLNALRSYRSIESGLRRRLSQQLSVNDTDLSALRYLFGVWQSGGSASPKELALALSISSASTTLVIDRLEKAGFIRRRRHPVDRRAVILEPGEKATKTFRESFDIEKRGVLAAADSLSSAETETVTRFLRSMEQAMADAITSQDESDAS